MFTVFNSLRLRITYISNTTMLFLLQYTNEQRIVIRVTVALCKYIWFYIEENKFFCMCPSNTRLCVHFNCRNCIDNQYLHVLSIIMTRWRFHILLSIYICNFPMMPVRIFDKCWPNNSMHHAITEAIIRVLIDVSLG